MIAAAAALTASCVTAGQGGGIAADLLRRRIAERAADCGEVRILLARPEGVPAALPLPLRSRWKRPHRIRGFAVRRVGSITVVTAPDTRRLIQGAGWVLRKIDTGGGKAHLTPPAALDSAPAYSVRMTQIGYRAKNNSYDAWTLPMFERRIEDLALWGATGVQLIAPISDDSPTSPLFPQPPRETLAGIARIAHRLGLDVALYYPELRDYRKAGTAEAELTAFAETLAELPYVDSLYVPGGDPGGTPPHLLFPLVEREAALLHRRNPAATVWLSAQGFGASDLEAFYAQLGRRPRWLTGIFVGPQSRDPLPVQRARVPRIYPIILYPDIAHTMHAQFPAPQWWPEFAMTEGREPINPRPRAYRHIFRQFAPLTTGFVTYSEGVNDDFNQYLWFRLGWDPAISSEQIALEYARSLIGDVGAARLPFALEANWEGDPVHNRRIDNTLAVVGSVHPAAFGSWRMDSFLYRALYDAIVRRRTIAARARLAATRAALTRGDAIAARGALNQPDGAEITQLRARLFAVADRLFDGIKLQLSVSRYGASSVERGANLDRVDADLTGRTYLLRAIAAAPDRAALARLADRPRAAEGALYDDLGRPDAEPHLIRGKGFATDPQLYDTAIDGIADHGAEDGWLPSQIDYAETLYDRPIRLHYEGLDPRRRYRLIASYAGEDYALPMRLVANGRFEIHPPLPRRTNPSTVEFVLPWAMTKGGTLDLAWSRPPGLGGSGRGHQVAETWLIPEPLSGVHP
jgi:hypothetical protein